MIRVTVFLHRYTAQSSCVGMYLNISLHGSCHQIYGMRGLISEILLKELSSFIGTIMLAVAYITGTVCWLKFKQNVVYNSIYQSLNELNSFYWTCHILILSACSNAHLAMRQTLVHQTQISLLHLRVIFIILIIFYEFLCLI